jgi:predicted ATPase
MQVSYLWVQKFRNIERQGFTFSTRYQFSYDYELNELKKENNERYLNDFFGNGISSITGLIGQNASGKTNLLELLLHVMAGANIKIGEPFFVVLEDENGVLFGLHFEMPFPRSESISFKPYKSEVEDFEALFISNVFDGRRHNFDKRIKDLSTNNLINNKFGENFHTLYNKEIQSQIKFINSKQFVHLEEVERLLHQNEETSFYPTHIRLTSPSWGNLQAKARSFDQMVKRTTDEKIASLEEFVKRFRKKMSSWRDDGSRLIYYTAFLVYLDFIINEVGDVEIKSNDNRRGFLEYVKLFLIVVDEKLDVRGVFDLITSLISGIDNKMPYGFERGKFLFEINNYNFINTIEGEQGKFSSQRIEFLIPYVNRVGNFIKRYLDVISAGTVVYSFEWEGISSGHKAYISLFSRFFDYYQKRKNKGKNILICIDEGDLYFHPKWQVEFIYKLINILPKIFKREAIQIIITTHSPFLVSDLPKDNLLFLRKNSEGKTDVIPYNNIHGETFGGNIGELYMDAFFLDGSLMSQFAYHKINQLVEDVINEKKEERPVSEFNLRLTEIIGEELIRNRIKQMIKDK